MAEITIAAENESTKDRVNVSVYVSKETNKKIVELAKARDLKKSDILREALREYLAEHEPKKVEA